MNHFDLINWILLASSFCQLDGFRLKEDLENAFTRKGDMHKRVRGKTDSFRSTLDTDIFGAEADYWKKGWKNGWEGCPAGWATITDPDDCIMAAHEKAEEYGLAMEDDDYEVENGFTAVTPEWPLGCVVNKGSNKVKFNDRKRVDGQLLKLDDAAMFKVICKKAVKYAYFDFDQTITRVHVFHSLVALGSRVEIGQVRKLMEVDKTTWKYDKKTSKVVEDPEGTPWSIAALGGIRRIDRHMRPYLAALKDAGVKLIVITKGNVGVARYILEQGKLLDLFETVYGNIGSNYAPATEYDLAHIVDATGYEGKPEVDLGNWGSKRKLITALMKQNDASFSEVVLVEDDEDEVDAVSDTCEALLVTKRKGVYSGLLRQLMALAGIRFPTARLYLCHKPSGGSSGAEVYDSKVLGSTSQVAYTFLEPTLSDKMNDMGLFAWGEGPFADPGGVEPLLVVPGMERFASISNPSRGWPLPIPPWQEVDSFAKKMCAAESKAPPCFDLIVDTWCPIIEEVQSSIKRLVDVALVPGGLYHVMPFTQNWQSLNSNITAIFDS